MELLDHICEKYLACWDKEMGLPEDRRCPHLLPHDHYPGCDWECDKEEVHCRKIILKKD